MPISNNTSLLPEAPEIIELSPGKSVSDHNATSVITIQSLPSIQVRSYYALDTNNNEAFQKPLPDISQPYELLEQADAYKSLVENLRIQVDTCTLRSLINIIPRRAYEASELLQLVDEMFKEIIPCGLAFVHLKKVPCQAGCHSCILLHGDTLTSSEITSLQVIADHMGSVLSMFPKLEEERRLLLGFELKLALMVLFKLKVDAALVGAINFMSTKKPYHISRFYMKVAEEWNLADIELEKHLIVMFRQVSKSDIRKALDFIPAAISDVRPLLSGKLQCSLSQFGYSDNLVNLRRHLLPYLTEEEIQSLFYLNLFQNHVFVLTERLCKKQRFLIWF